MKLSTLPCLAALGLLLVARAHAQDAPGAPPPAPDAVAPSAAVGEATRAWLELQRSGRAAAAERTIPGEIAELQWRRYVESYRHPIPESFRSPLQEAGGGK